MRNGINRDRARGIAALVATAGCACAVQASLFTFTPQCSLNWYGECTTTACSGGGWHTYNNWNNNHDCSGALPTPGTFDDVFLPAGMVRQNGTIWVNSVTTDAGAQWEWDTGNITIAQPFTQAGTMNVNSGAKSATGTVTNGATWNFADTNGWVFYFQGLTFTNNATINQSNMQVNANGGANTFVNNGLFVKAHASDTQWVGVPITNNGTVRADLGTQRFNSVPITSTSPVARWNSGPSGALGFDNCTITGAIVGDGKGTTWINTMTLGGALTLDIQGNGMAWVTSNINLAGNTLTNAPTGRVDVWSGSKSAIGGSIVNNGAWTFADTNGWTFYFQDLALTNNAIMTQVNSHVSPNGGVNSFVNNGSYIKNHSSTTNWVGVPFTNNSLVRADVGVQVFTGAPITSTDPAARWDTGAGAALVFNGCSLRGAVTGNGLGETSFSSMALSGPLSWNIDGNGMVWTSGDLNLAGNTLTIAPSGRARVLSGSKSVIGGTVENNGVWTFADTNGWTCYFQGLSLINNGTVQQATMHVSSNGGTNGFVNNGAYVKAFATMVNWNVVPVTNNGLVRVDEGMQQFISARLSSVPAARWDTAADSALIFWGDTFSGTFKGSGNGYTGLSTGAFADDTTVDFAGNGLTWQGGDVTVIAGKSLTNAGSGVFTVTDAGTKSLVGHVVNNGQWSDTGNSGWTFYFQDATFTNNGVLTKRAMHWNANGGANQIVNNGVFSKVDATPVAITGIPVTNNGLLDVHAGSLSLVNSPFTQSATGETIVDGVFGVNSIITVSAGRISGGGTIALPGGANPGLTNAGTVVAPGDGVGTLTISGNYTQQATGVLEIMVAGTTPGSFDRLAVTGNAALDGTLKLVWEDWYVPAVGETYTILTTGAGGRSGVFSSIDNTETGYLVDLSYTSSAVVVSVVGVTCDSIDFNRDGLIPDVDDIRDFISVFSGGPCPTGTCGDIDFNNDGLFPDTADIDALIRVFSGGSCS